ncbi:four helix bundle protein [Lacinutrix cladophorae]
MEKEKRSKLIVYFNMYQYSFEKLEVWKETKELTKTIYNTTNTFPNKEKYWLCSQLRINVESITNKLNALKNYQIKK